MSIIIIILVITAFVVAGLFYLGAFYIGIIILLSPVFIGFGYTIVDNYNTKNMAQCTFSNYNNNEIVKNFIDNNNNDEQFICIPYKEDEICIFKENQYNNLLSIVDNTNKKNKIYIDIKEKTYMKQ